MKTHTTGAEKTPTIPATGAGYAADLRAHIERLEAEQTKRNARAVPGMDSGAAVALADDLRWSREQIDELRAELAAEVGPEDRLPRWDSLTLYGDDGETLSDADRIAKLREYRATHAMAGAFFVPPGRTPESRDAASYEGPSVDEIDWAGFPEEHDATIDLWEDNGGGLAIVCRKTGRGFCGFERGQNVARLRAAGRDEFTFASDATAFAELGEGSLYDALPADEVEALYHREGEANAAVRVASYQSGAITVHAGSIGAAARWYLDGAG